MIKQTQTSPVPTHGNWVEERGFGQQPAPSAQNDQFRFASFEPRETNSQFETTSLCSTRDQRSPLPSQA